MKIANKRIYSADQEYLARLRSEYELIGFETRLETGLLIVYPRHKKDKRRRKDS